MSGRQKQDASKRSAYVARRPTRSTSGAKSGVGAGKSSSTDTVFNEGARVLALESNVDINNPRNREPKYRYRPGVVSQVKRKGKSVVEYRICFEDSSQVVGIPCSRVLPVMHPPGDSFPDENRVKNEHGSDIPTSYFSCPEQCAAFLNFHPLLKDASSRKNGEGKCCLGSMKVSLDQFKNKDGNAEVLVVVDIQNRTDGDELKAMISHAMKKLGMNISTIPTKGFTSYSIIINGPKNTRTVPYGFAVVLSAGNGPSILHSVRVNVCEVQCMGIGSFMLQFAHCINLWEGRKPHGVELMVAQGVNNDYYINRGGRVMPLGDMSDNYKLFVDNWECTKCDHMLLPGFQSNIHAVHHGVLGEMSAQLNPTQHKPSRKRKKGVEEYQKAEAVANQPEVPEVNTKKAETVVNTKQAEAVAEQPEVPEVDLYGELPEVDEVNPQKAVAVEESPEVVDVSWRKEGHKLIGKTVLLKSPDGESAQSSIKGIVIGWISESDKDSKGNPEFVSEFTDMPADLFHVEFDDFVKDLEEREMVVLEDDDKVSLGETLSPYKRGEQAASNLQPDGELGENSTSSAEEVLKNVESARVANIGKGSKQYTLGQIENQCGHSGFDECHCYIRRLQFHREEKTYVCSPTPNMTIVALPHGLHAFRAKSSSVRLLCIGHTAVTLYLRRKCNRMVNGETCSIPSGTDFFIRNVTQGTTAIVSIDRGNVISRGGGRGGGGGGLTGVT